MNMVYRTIPMVFLGKKYPLGIFELNGMLIHMRKTPTARYTIWLAGLSINYISKI